MKIGLKGTLGSKARVRMRLDRGIIYDRDPNVVENTSVVGSVASARKDGRIGIKALYQCFSSLRPAAVNRNLNCKTWELFVPTWGRTLRTVFA